MELVVSTSTDPAYNLSTEEFLFSTCKGEYAFFYRNNPCVIIGSNQVWQNEVNVDFCEENQIPVLRRISGGGAVYHDRGNLNYSFISHKSVLNPGTTSDFLYPVVESLARLGIMSVIGQRKDLWLPGGYKISGTASHVTPTRVMQHGTMLYDSNLEMLQGALTPACKSTSAKGTASVPSPVRNILDYLIDRASTQYREFPGATAFFNQFIGELKQLLKLSGVFTPDSADTEKIVALKNERYDMESWNYKK